MGSVGIATALPSTRIDTVGTTGRWHGLSALANPMPWKSTRATFNKDDFVIGDWNCPSCSTKNYASFAFCKKCGTAKEIKEIN